ncbi:TIGR00282 family metallophosphoesterase [bacterium]|nr:TIGR00282 family metallophosphoesterase [bacterium]
MNILFIADIFGKAGRRAVLELLPGLKDQYNIHFTIANGENAAGGYGITPKIATKFFRYGVDVITSGNHIWDRRDQIDEYLDTESRLLRPVNYPPVLPGKGHGVYLVMEGCQLGVINLQGRVFMANIDCPFRVGEVEVQKMREETHNIIIDLHAETTAEKLALGHYFDGKVSAVIGTHTHIQTADECILPGGTAYITDAGMTGPHDSVIGIRKHLAIERMITQTKVKFAPAKTDIRLSGVVVAIDENSGKSTSIERISVSLPGMEIEDDNKD